MSSPTDNLVLLVGRKLQCLQKLQELGRGQQTLISQGDIPGLMELLAEKDRFVTALHAIQGQLKPYQNQDPAQLQWSTPEGRTDCQEALAACEQLLLEIMQDEKQCEQDLILRRDEAAVRMQGVHQSNQAARAYVTTDTRSGGQLDLTSDS